MNSPQIRFEDGAAYETYMGVWSRDVGEAFLRWLAPAPGWRWADVGCGNGAFTEMLVERCAPVSVQGIDPSEAQLAYAASDVLHLHDLRKRLDTMLAREGRTELAAACFGFLPARARLDLAGWGAEDIFAHS